MNRLTRMECAQAGFGRVFGFPGMRCFRLAVLASLALTAFACNASGTARRPAQAAASASSDTSAASTQSSSGIFGHLITAWGNAPAKLPPSKCVKVFDASGKKLVAEGTCTGISRSFRIQLKPGHYVVELGGHWEQAPGGKTHFVPNRRHLIVQPRQWIDISPQGPSRPLP